MILLPFQQLPTYLANRRVVVVDFSSKHCGPCRQLPSLLHELEQQTRATVVQVDIEDAPRLCERYGISSVPVVAVFQFGREVRRLTGVPSVSRLVEVVRPYI